MSLVFPIELRTAVYNDMLTIQQIAQETWPSTYSDIISQKQINYMLDWMYSDDSLSQQFSEGTTFIIAEIGDVSVGFAGFAPKEKGVFKLDKLYVLPDGQNSGAGKLLLKEVIKRVLDAGGRELQLQVNRRNKAVGFYQKMGFTIVKEFEFNIGQGYVMDDYIMSLPLTNA